MAINDEMSFEEMMNSFLGREIEEIEVNPEDAEVMIYLNDGAAMCVGTDDNGDIYILRMESDETNTH